MERQLRHFERPELEPSVYEDQVSPSGVYIALFEALNWAVSLDDRLANDWPDNVGRAWQGEVENGGAIRGLRYARNCVHHDWALAVPWPSQPVDRGSVAERLDWVEVLSSGRPDPVGADAYRQHLGGESVIVSLSAFLMPFIQGVKRLEGASRATWQSPRE